MFLGREKELNALNEFYEKSGGQMIFLYGRRRVGKTETLKEFVKDKPAVFFTCRECTDKLQLKNFSEEMFKEDIAAKKYISEFTDWESAFKSIVELPFGDKKKLLIIDEFPYMCRGNMEIPSILQKIWDQGLKNENIMFIFCGSAMSFIEKELLSEKNPLYGRSTGIYKMEPMGFFDAIKFFPNYSMEDKIKVYSILGGVPHYLAQFNPEKSLEENIKKNILQKGSVLYSETEFLLRQELREISVYNSLIEAVALGNTKLNEICQKALIDNPAMASTYLKNLIELKIVRKEFSIDAGVKEHANKNRGMYFLTDNFFRFWYKYVYGNLSELEAGDVDGVYKYSVLESLDLFTSYTFEDVCRQYVQKMNMSEQLPFRYEKMGRWYGKTTVRKKSEITKAESEIDILALSDKEQKCLIGECKYKNAPFSYSDYLDLSTKLLEIKETKEVFYMLFSKSGFDEKILELAEGDKHLLLLGLNNIEEV